MEGFCSESTGQLALGPIARLTVLLLLLHLHDAQKDETKGLPNRHQHCKFTLAHTSITTGQ
jgi:hypothetical protein